MARLCERPGCSEPASAAYGMQPQDLVFWIDHLSPVNTDRGVLCKQHADSMVVPRGWTLNDLREPHLRLFRPPTAPAVAPPPSRRRRAAHVSDDTQQLELSVDAVAAAIAATADPPTADVRTTDMPAADTATAPVDDGSAEVQTKPEPSPPPPQQWAPRFDEADDLDGVLAARSPLLNRAFRGGDRPR